MREKNRAALEKWENEPRVHLFSLPLLPEVLSEVVLSGSKEHILKNIKVVQLSHVIDEKIKAKSHTEI